MITDEQLRNALRAFVQRNAAGGTLLGKVQSVNETENTCTVVDDDNPDVVYNDVQLRPVLDGEEAMTIYPAINSWVMMQQVEDTGRLMVTAYGKASKWKLKVGAATVEQDATGLNISKNGDSLKQILNDILTQITAITCNVTAVGAPTGVPINSAAFTSINARVNSLLK